MTREEKINSIIDKLVLLGLVVIKDEQPSKDKPTLEPAMVNEKV